MRLLNKDVFSGKCAAMCIGHNVTRGAGEVLLDDVRQVGKGGSGRSKVTASPILNPEAHQLESTPSLQFAIPRSD